MEEAIGMQSATEVLAAGHLTTHDMESGAKGPQSQPPRLKDSSSLEKSLIKRRQEGRQKQQKHRERTLSLKRLRTAASPNVVFAEECNRVMAQCMETVALELHRTRHAAIKALGQVRNCVSQELQGDLDMALIWERVVPVLVRVLLIRPGSHLAREAVLEAAWICTNLACAGPEPASAVLAAAPVLILHLDCAHSYEVAEQCAWALGNLVGDGRDACEVLAANGAMLPLGRLLLRAGKTQSAGASQAAVCAAWALSNTLFSSPSEAGHLLGLNSFPKAFVAIVRGHHSRELATEAAWLLALITAGPEAHMHAMVKHGAAEAVASALSSASLGHPYSEESEAMLDPLLRSAGNMAASTAAVKVLGTPHVTSVLIQMQQHSFLAEEAAWVLDNLAAADR